MHGEKEFKPFVRWRYRILILILLLGLFYALSVSFLGLNEWLLLPVLSKHAVEKADAIFIPGASTHEDGSPYMILKKRLDKGASLFLEGFAKWIIVSGGLNEFQYLECEVMRTYLIERGVPANTILCECASTSTYENVHFGMPIFIHFNINKVLVVTSASHTQRCEWLFKSVQMHPICIPADLGPHGLSYKGLFNMWIIHYMILREYAAHLAYQWQDKYSPKSMEVLKKNS